VNDNAQAVWSVVASLFTIVMLRQFGLIGAVTALIGVYVITFALNRAMVRRKRIKAGQDR